MVVCLYMMYMILYISDIDGLSSGPWPSENGPWPSKNGPWPTENGPQPSENGSWPSGNDWRFISARTLFWRWIGSCLTVL